MTTEIDAEGLRYPMAKRSAYWTFDEKSAETVGNLYYFAPLDRAPPPYLTQRHVEAIIDIAADGTLAGVELIDNMPPPPRATTRTSEAEPVAVTMTIDREALRKRIENDPDEGEIGAGFEMFTPEAEVALERMAFAALPRWAQDELTALRAAATLTTTHTSEAEPVAFQQRVAPWMEACFGPEISADKLERNDRFMEEALELVQATGYPKERAYALIEYVYGRDQGEINQEVGGVMVTLAAHCLSHGVDMHEAAETELARIWTKVEKIRAKQAAKPTGSALPVAHPTPASDDQVEAVTDEMVERAALALAKRNDVPQWREFIPDARAALLAAMGVPSHEHDAGELADAYRDLAARQTDTEPDIAKVVRDNRSKLYMPLDDATVRSGEEG